MRLLIVSHTPHYLSDDGYVGWGPTVRELDYLAELFEEVVHIAPLYRESAPASSIAYHSSRVLLRYVDPAGGHNIHSKLDVLRAYPRYAAVIRDEMNKADAVHVRCPANISLLALLLLQREQRPPYRWVKYAGNWMPDGKEAWSYTLQRRWLTKNRHRGVVTVNGRWPEQPSHIQSFFNPSLTEEELRLGQVTALQKTLDFPLNLLFVGALNEPKGVGRILKICLAFQLQGIPFRLHLVGDGPDRARYEAWIAENGLLNVFFHGWVPRQEIPRFLAEAHFILLPSLSSEGWPKVLSEAMAFGVVPIASTISSIPQVLSTTKAGLAFPAEDTSSMVDAIVRLVNEPAAWLDMSRAGLRAARQFTYRYYQEAVKGLFAQAWGVGLIHPSDKLRVEEVIFDEMKLTGSPQCSSWNGDERN
jgi:glycosyltransferase involved in cell wall biosynthesis